MIFITYIFTAVMAQTHIGRDVLIAIPEDYEDYQANQPNISQV